MCWAAHALFPYAADRSTNRGCVLRLTAAGPVWPGCSPFFPVPSLSPRPTPWPRGHSAGRGQSVSSRKCLKKLTEDKMVISSNLYTCQQALTHTCTLTVYTQSHACSLNYQLCRITLTFLCYSITPSVFLSTLFFSLPLWLVVLWWLRVDPCSMVSLEKPR